MDLVSSFTNEVVNKALDGSSMRHTAIASNLANVDTPGYQKKQVSFETQLESAIQIHHNNMTSKNIASNGRPLQMKATQSGHVHDGVVVQDINDVTPQLEETDNQEYRNDGNSVDVETEMVRLARNTQRYIALNNVQGRLMRGTRDVISQTDG